MKQSKIGLRALTRARLYIGVHDWDPRILKWLRNTGVNGQAPWCAAFAWSMVYEASSKKLPIPGAAAVESWVKWAQAVGDLVQRPFAGDFVCYDWNGDYWYDHIGIVEKVLAVRWRGNVFAGWVRTIEGNTLGGQVARRWRWINRAVFVRVKD